MVNSQSSAQAASTLKYEELLEEMEKLDIADLLLIHRRVAMRWVHFLKGPNIKSTHQLIAFLSAHYRKIAIASTPKGARQLIHIQDYAIQQNLRMVIMLLKWFALERAKT